MPSEHVIDVTAQTFQTEVVDYSHNTPVLVDFWAEWCGPCKQLTPMLEQLAEEFRGAFRLAKVDTDVEQQLAMTFRIQSIPTVCIVWGGRVLDQFQGAVPMEQLRQLLNQLFQELNITIPDEQGVPTDPTRARAYFQNKLAKEPNDGEALVGLGRLEVGDGNTDGATALFKKVEAASTHYTAAQAALATLGLLEQVAEAGGEDAARTKLQADPSDQRAAYLVACADAGAGRFVASLEALVALIATGTAEVKDDAKKDASVVFEAAGREDDQVEQLRRKLARLLF